MVREGIAFLIEEFCVGELVYDININYLGVRSQESGGKKEEERIVDGESFLFALLSGQEIIPQISNAKNLIGVILNLGLVIR
ncbi:hypothetical protein ACP6PL_23975 [Dapis sp. BLCC M126]|uniref:hypothetical protein n=1 Tax=Dapis sp. BLCC M126 TaxID=3400189 RepID=UPI003CED9E43